LKNKKENNPIEILDIIQIGINLPVNSLTKPYILHDLKMFNSSSLLLVDNSKPKGHVLIYSDNEDILYFGFFGVKSPVKENISILVKWLIDYAEAKGFKFIRGPINIPTIIYGWGFSKEKSKTDLYVGKPTTPPVYYETFLQHQFLIKYEELTHETPMYRLNPYKMKKYDFSDYKVFFPKNYQDLILNFKQEILRIHSENMPPSAQITPNVSKCFDNYADFVMKYGSKYMFNLVKFLPEDKYIAAATCVPDIFNIKEKGITFHSWAVDSSFRRRGLSILMSGAITLKLWKKYSLAVGHTGVENKVSIAASQKLARKITRAHLILEYCL